MRYADEVFLAVPSVFVSLQDSKVEFVGTHIRTSAQERKSDF